MSDSRTLRRAAAVVAAALVIPTAPALGAGSPLPAEGSADGVAAPGAGGRFVSVTMGRRTAVLALDRTTGAMIGRADLRGSFSIPRVAFDGTSGGLSADGRTLVLIKPRVIFPRERTTLAIMSTRPYLRVRRTVRLRGDFSYDALSPDGRSLFLVNYVSQTDPTKYRVRVYDLARDRLERKAIVDPREEPDEMNGIPMSRVMSPDGRWAYTLYQRAGRTPFIHALDTRDRKAVCIDLDDSALANANLSALRLRIAAGGARLDLRHRNGAIEAIVDTKTFRALSGPAAVRAARAAAAAGNSPGPHMLWPALAALLLGAALLTRVVLRRRPRTRASRAVSVR